jgi:ArsR family transcriptional regulator
MLDAATLMLVLHHVAEPEAALAEVARTLKPGGHLVIVDMMPHDREHYRQQMGHAWLGFSAEYMTRTLRESGFLDATFVPMPSESRAKGPGLFVSRATKA